MRSKDDAPNVRARASTLPAFAKCEPLVYVGKAHGFDVVQIAGHPFQRPLIDLVRLAHPGATWDAVSFAGDLAARAWLDGRTVGIVLGLRC